DNRALARVDGVREIGRDEPWPAAAVAVDALLGTGAAGPARGDVLALAQRLVAYGATLVAVDGPTGLDLSSGEPHGPVRAALSVTFGGPRRGREARGRAGDDPGRPGEPPRRAHLGIGARPGARAGRGRGARVGGRAGGGTGARPRARARPVPPGGTGASPPPDGDRRRRP